MLFLLGLLLTSIRSKFDVTAFCNIPSILLANKSDEAIRVALSLYLLILSLLNLKQSRTKLKDFNDFSQATHDDFARDVNKYTQIVKTMKQDLVYVFKHTR